MHAMFVCVGRFVLVTILGEKKRTKRGNNQSIYNWECTPEIFMNNGSLKTWRKQEKDDIFQERLTSLSRTRMHRSRYSSLDIQNDSLSFMTSARTAPPINTMSLRRGGSSMRILNFCPSVRPPTRQALKKERKKDKKRIKLKNAR